MFPPFRWMMHRRRGLRTWIISILANAPKNGAEIMDEIETMTQGWWRPSPGSVYPLLEQMTQEDLLKKRDDGPESTDGRGYAERDAGVRVVPGRPQPIRSIEDRTLPGEDQERRRTSRRARRDRKAIDSDRFLRELRRRGVDAVHRLLLN